MKFIFSSFILLLSFNSALACSCPRWEYMPDERVNKYLDEIAAIFEGEVVSIGDQRRSVASSSEVRRTDFEVRPVRFVVSRVWKGSESMEIEVEADAVSSCGFVPSLGTKGIFYAHGKPGQLSIGICSFKSFDDKRMKARFGSGKEITQPKSYGAARQIEETFVSSSWKWIVSWVG